jgi:DHA2 family multidrug resistance protein
MANVMMFALGFVLLGSTVLLPLMLQTLMGYTATQAGMALSPGGIVIILILPFVGMALSRGVQAKWIIMTGLVISAVGLIWMSRFSLGISFSDAVLARIVQAAGIAFLFVPINTIAYAFLPRNKNNDASGLVNLSRNVGGSVGIAFATTLVARRSQVHQSYLSAHTTLLDPAYVHTLDGMKHTLVAQGMSLIDAAQHAPAMMYQILQQQASMLAYVDVFRVMAIVFLAVVPIALLLKKTRPGEAPIAAH